MEKVRRSIKYQVVTIADRTGSIIESFTANRKTDPIKETTKAIKRLKRVDLDVKVEDVTDVYEMDLEFFLDHATKLESEIE